MRYFHPSRFSLLLAVCFLVSLAGAESPFRLIAHRGGVVDENHAENSPAAVRTAIERGYWMLEVDVRSTSDNRAILQHDADFQKFYGDPRPVETMSWDQVAKLRAQPGDSRPMLFAELVEMCAGKVGLMIDVKGDHSQPFYQALAADLANHNMLSETMVLGSPLTRSFFLGKARVQADRRQIETAVEAGEDVGKRYFLFEWGLVLDQPAIQRARQLGVTVVPSVNWFHYERHGQDPLKGAARDIANLKRWGVTHFQIDSIYEQFLQ